MANRRMFSLDVVDTDNFLDMPLSAQGLYFHLGMRADDDGFISSPKKIIKIVNASEDDLKLLILKGYLIPFESGVIVISDWCVNNYIRADRKHSTRFTKEFSLLSKDKDTYKLRLEDHGNQMTTIIQPSDNQATDKWHTEVRLGKDSVGKDSVVKDSINIYCTELEKTSSMPTEPPVITLTLNDKTEYPIYNKDIEQWQELYPVVDILQELRKMKGWLDANCAKRKTKRGIKRFVNGWLTKEQDKGGYRVNGRCDNDYATNTAQIKERQYQYGEVF